MMFRQAAHGFDHAPHGRVLWGPFPAGWNVLGVSFATLFLGAVFFLMSLHHEHLQCAASHNTMCSVNARAVFTRASIRRVDVAIERGSKNTKYGVVTFTLDNAHTYRMMQVDPDEAEQARRSIQSSLASNAEIDVDLREPRVMLFLGIAGLIAFVAFGIAGLARMGHFDLVISPDGQALLVRRSVFAFPLGSRRLSLARVGGVVVERKSIMPPLASRYGTDVRHARLALTYRGVAAIEPLTTTFFPGHALHLRAAAALRRALEVDPNDVDDHELAQIPMRTTPTTQRLGYAWAGLTTGSLLGLALFGLSMLFLHQITMRGNLEGWVVACGMIPGAIGGVALVWHATRPRLPR